MKSEFQNPPSSDSASPASQKSKNTAKSKFYKENEKFVYLKSKELDMKMSAHGKPKKVSKDYIQNLLKDAKANKKVEIGSSRSSSVKSVNFKESIPIP